MTLCAGWVDAEAGPASICDVLCGGAAAAVLVAEEKAELSPQIELDFGSFEEPSSLSLEAKAVLSCRASLLDWNSHKAVRYLSCGVMQRGRVFPLWPILGDDELRRGGGVSIRSAAHVAGAGEVLLRGGVSCYANM